MKLNHQCHNNALYLVMTTKNKNELKMNSNNNKSSSILTDKNMDRSNTNQILKIGTLGTALYGFYLGYVSQLNTHVDAQWATLHKFNIAPLEREYLLFIMIPNNVKVLQSEIKNALKVKYGIDPDVALLHLPIEMNKWTEYRQVIDETISLLSETTTTSSTTMDSMGFFKRCMSAFHITNTSLLHLREDEKINDIKAHVLANMENTFNTDLIRVVGIINRELNRNGDPNFATSIQRTIAIIEQAVMAGVINIREIIAFKDKLPASMSTSPPSITQNIPYIIQMIQRICESQLAS